MAAEKNQARTKGANKRGTRDKWTLPRRCVQIGIFLLFLIPVVASGWALAGFFYQGDALGDAGATPSQLPFYGTLSSSSIGPVTLLDPYAMLQTICAAKTFDPAWLLAALPVLLVFGLIRGRAFCGWVCPVNLVGELVDYLRTRFMKNNLSEQVLPRHVKVWAALAILVLSLLASVPVYESINPISFLNKGLVFGSMVGGITLLVIIVLELFWGHRVWCRCLCPLGGFYEVLGKVGFVKIAIDHDKCIACGKCQKACLSDPEILDLPIAGASDFVCAGDCMVCGKCVDTCPQQALSFVVAPPTVEQLHPVKVEYEYVEVEEEVEVKA